MYTSKDRERLSEVFDGVRCVTFSDDYSYCITWYGNSLLHLFRAWDMKEVDVRTMSDDSLTWQEVRVKSIDWIKEIYSEE